MAEVEYSIADLITGPLYIDNEEPERAPEVAEIIMEVKEEFESTKIREQSEVSNRVAMGRKDF